jgi:diguanylate cyclase (GGDEF)-like protein
VSKRHAGHLRVVRDEPSDSPLQIRAKGRPREEGRGFNPMTFVVRVLIVAWAGAIAATLVEEFSQLQHTPFMIAMAMTGLLVVVSFLMTREGVPDWRGDPVSVKSRDEDAEPGTDLLTELPTFAVFKRRIDDAFGRSRRMGKQFSVVLVDVNNLTAVNKEYGVRAGDEVLRHVAKAVDSTRRYNDVVSRLGDDEFGVLLLDCEEQGARAFVDRLEERLSRESAAADVNGRTISLWAGVCSGAATSLPSMTEPDAVLEAAMENLNQAKHDRERRRRTWLTA